MKEKLKNIKPFLFPPGFKPETPPWINEEWLPCPCGSGLTFFNCCKSYLPQGNDMIRHFDETKPLEAEKAYRGALTKYLGYVFRHTIPLLKQSPDNPPIDIINIDIESIDSLLKALLPWLGIQGKQSEVIGLLDHLIQMVHLPGFSERMISWKAIWFHSVLNNVQEAEKLIRCFDIEKTEDRMILQLYLDYFGHDLPPLSKINLIEKVIKNTDNPAELLQYHIAMTIELHMLGEEDKAKKTLDNAIKKNVSKIKDKENPYSLKIIAGSYEIKCKLGDCNKYFTKALSYYNKIPLDTLNSKGKADIEYCIATLYKDNNYYDEAIVHYERSIKEFASQPSVIHLAEAYLMTEQLDEGKKVLSQLLEEDVANSYMLEYLQVKALIGILEKNTDAIHDMLTKIKALTINDSYFRNSRDQYCFYILEQLDVIKKSDSEGTLKVKSKSVWEKLQTACQYLELKPNFLGLGFDLNKMIGSPPQIQNPHIDNDIDSE